MICEVCSSCACLASERQAKGPEALSRRARAFFETVGLSRGIDLGNQSNLVAVDFIGGDGTKCSIPCLEDDDRDHERGGEGLGRDWQAGDGALTRGAELSR